MSHLFIDFCSINPLIPWLLSGLLGLGLGWLLWGKYKGMVADLEANITDLKKRISSLEGDLDICRKSKSELDGTISLLKGRIREMELAAEGDSKIIASAAPAVNVSSAMVSGSSKWDDSIRSNNLQIIEGIGPKMEEVLSENGLSTFEQLAESNPTELRTILDKYGDKYRIIDPNTWPQQAVLARDKKWNELIELQKNLDTGRSDTATDGHTDAKLEKWLIKAGILKKWNQDDLKAIEGVGPKIEELLHNAGIKTWRALSQTSVESIQEILRAAGSRFALADPGTWPKQAEMAADGKWDELQEYQDFLNGGKEK